MSGPGFEDYPYISADRPKQGATAVWRYHSGLLRFDFNLVVSKSDRGRMLYIANTSAFGAGMEIYVSSAPAERRRSIMRRSEPNLLGRVFAAMMNRKLEKQIDQTVANLKRYCEASASNDDEAHPPHGSL